MSWRMFVRVKTIGQDGRRYEYLQIVRSVRDGARVRQELVASLGRRDLLVATGQLDQLLRALARFSTRLRVVEAASDERFVARGARSWGAALVFDRLWQRQGLPEILARLAKGRRFGFDSERVAFALALQRLCAPGSDLQGAAWAQTVEAPGFDGLALHHFYRTLPWLAAIRHELERELFFQDRDLFSAELDLVFVDTTSVYLYRDGASDLVRHGYSRDRRPDLPQLVLCVAVDGRGWPVAFDVLPGNTADVEALRLTIARFRERFRIRRAVVVADRGMLGKGTLAELRAPAEAPFDYILGCLPCAASGRSPWRCSRGQVATTRSPTTSRSKRCGSASAGTSSAATRSKPSRMLPTARPCSPSCAPPSNIRARRRWSAIAAVAAGVIFPRSAV